MKRRVYSWISFVSAMLMSFGLSNAWAGVGTVTVQLRASDGVSGVPGAIVSYYKGGKTSLGTTDADGNFSALITDVSGTTTIYLDPLSGGTRIWLLVDPATNPTLTAQMVAVTINLKTCEGVSLTGEALYSKSGWTSVGNTPVILDLLPYTGLTAGMQGGYDFQVKYNGRTSATIRQDIAVDPVVVFNTTKVTSNFVGSTYYYNSGWQLFTNPSEVMGGTQNYSPFGVKTADFKFGSTGATTYTFNITGCDVTVGPPTTAYTLTYTAGSGGIISGTSPQTVNSGGNGTQVEATPNTGYHFLNWSDGVLTAARTDLSVTANLTVTANFAINTYTVTFDANGGTGSMSPQSANYNTTTALTANAFTRTGYTFTGWNTAANGNGTAYADGQNYDFTASITLHAQWTAVSQTLTFESNGGTSVDPITQDFGTTVSAPPDPIKTGYMFGGWYNEIDLTTPYDFPHTMDLSTTIYAKWDSRPPLCFAPPVECQPDPQVTIVGENAQFTACTSGDPTPTIQWQLSTDAGATFNDISGENNQTLAVNNVTLSQNGYLYKAKFTNNCGNAFSDPAALTVKMLVKDLGPVEIALGSPSNSNNNQKVDLKVEFFKNDDPTPICVSELLKQQIVGNPQNNLSKIYTFSLPRLTGENASFLPTDVLYCRVSARKSGGVTAAVALNMWYDGSPTAGGNQGNKAYSRIWKVTVGGSTQDYYYFRSGNDLNAAAGSAATFASMASVPTSYASFGTWSILGANMKRGVDGQIIPATTELQRNYPNPFNPSTTIGYGVPEQSIVRLVVYDILGREVGALVDGVVDAGYHSVVWNTNGDAKSLASGVYIYRLTAVSVATGKEHTQFSKMLLTK